MKRQNFSQRGVSLVEIILVIVVVIGLALLIANLPKSVALVSRSQHTSTAKDIVNKQMTKLRTTAYSSLTNGTSAFTNPQLSSLAAASASSTIENCPVSVCSNNEDVKKVTVTLTWKEQGETKKVTVTSLVTNGGIGK